MLKKILAQMGVATWATYFHAGILFGLSDPKDGDNKFLQIVN
jgi:hypothetical protein